MGSSSSVAAAQLAMCNHGTRIPCSSRSGGRPSIQGSYVPCKFIKVPCLYAVPYSGTIVEISRALVFLYREGEPTAFRAISRPPSHSPAAFPVSLFVGWPAKARLLSIPPPARQRLWLQSTTRSVTACHSPLPATFLSAYIVGLHPHSLRQDRSSLLHCGLPTSLVYNPRAVKLSLLPLLPLPPLPLVFPHLPTVTCVQTSLHCRRHGLPSQLSTPLTRRQSLISRLALRRREAEVHQ